MNRFDEFWAAYPNKKAKGDARKAWKTTGAEKHFDAIMAKLPEYIAYVNHPKQSYLSFKMPAGWLRDERWEDEYEVEPTQLALGPNEARMNELADLFARTSPIPQQRLIN